ncbi:hypothetical protein SCA6_006054 [Theobroma cacao]
MCFTSTYNSELLIIIEALVVEEVESSDSGFDQTPLSLWLRDENVEAASEALNLLKCSSTSEVDGCDLEGKLFERTWRQTRFARSLVKSAIDILCNHKQWG